MLAPDRMPMVEGKKMANIWKKLSSGLLQSGFSKSRTTSAKPTVLSAQARALAKENTTPIGPPISGPREREIMKYAPPENEM
ncbi:hypothetical protein EYF80_050961 [Liparis tanakae]|uniref:Uncharacterized protein n=1 Tax=Liparis tanakae TaxID=230148 RepID=A0A4Z2FCA7_9TELE|nr:hypothetical protein EYF80_050961 [Liparis tanakae]